MDFITYITVSQYLTYAVLAIAAPALVIRVLRIFPTYVKTGKLGNKNNTLWLTVGNNAGIKTHLRNFFTETHPDTIFGDTMLTILVLILLFVAWPLIPIIVSGRLLWLGVGKVARYMRKQHLKKEEFVRSLRGD